MGTKKKLPPVHPAEVLREDYLIPAKVTVNALAMALHVPVSRMYEIVNCARAITPETALRLARHLGTSAEFLARPAK
jgi:antitoxin HigA-1